MKLITQRTMILAVADRWRSQYGLTEKDPGKQKIQRDLDALNKAKATAADVRAIIGNDSWTDLPDCDECEKKAAVLVEVGQEPDYESSTAVICKRCLTKAIALVGNGKGTSP